MENNLDIGTGGDSGGSAGFSWDSVQLAQATPNQGAAVINEAGQPVDTPAAPTGQSATPAAPQNQGGLAAVSAGVAQAAVQGFQNANAQGAANPVEAAVKAAVDASHQGGANAAQTAAVEQAVRQAFVQMQNNPGLNLGAVLSQMTASAFGVTGIPGAPAPAIAATGAQVGATGPQAGMAALANANPAASNAPPSPAFVQAPIAAPVVVPAFAPANPMPAAAPTPFVSTVSHFAGPSSGIADRAYGLTARPELTALTGAVGSQAAALQGASAANAPAAELTALTGDRYSAAIAIQTGRSESTLVTTDAFVGTTVQGAQENTAPPSAPSPVAPPPVATQPPPADAPPVTAEPSEPSSRDIHVVVESDDAYIDRNANGVRDEGENTVAIFGGDDDNVDLAGKDVTIHFNAPRASAPIDFTGFGAGDKIEIDVQAMAEQFLGESQLFEAADFTENNFITGTPLLTGWAPGWIYTKSGWQGLAKAFGALGESTGATLPGWIWSKNDGSLHARYFTYSSITGDRRPELFDPLGTHLDLSNPATQISLVNFVAAQPVVFVVVERNGAFIDNDGNGVKDANDTTAADFTGNADLTANRVVVHFNDIPLRALDLTGFDARDKIEIDVGAFVKNGIFKPVALDGVTSINISNTAEFALGDTHTFTVNFNTNTRTGFDGYTRETVYGFSINNIAAAFLATDSSSKTDGMLAYWSNGNANNALGQPIALVPGIATTTAWLPSSMVAAFNEGNDSENRSVVDFIWPTQASHFGNFVPTIALSAASNSGSTNDLVTTDTTPTFTIALDPVVRVGDAVHLVDADGKVLAVRILDADDRDNGSVELTVPDWKAFNGSGVGSYTARLVDAAGNISSSAAIDVSFDAMPPTLRVPDWQADTGAFGGDGIADLATMGNMRLRPSALWRLDDGKLLVAGRRINDGDDAFVVRYNADGTLDTTFDSDGMAASDLGLTIGGLKFAGKDGGDNLYFATSRYQEATGYDFAVLKLTSSGAVDTGYGASGLVAIQPAQLEGYGVNHEMATSILVNANGSLYIAGNTNADGYVAKLAANGSLDTTFSANGVARYSSLDYVHFMVADGNGGLYLGQRNPDTGYDLQGTVIHVNSSGAQDMAFAGDGTLNYLPAYYNAPLIDMKVDDAGNLVLLTQLYSNFIVRRFLSNGSVDSGFGDNPDLPGSITIANAEGASFANRIGVEGRLSGELSFGADGSLAIVVTAQNNGQDVMLAARVTADGKPLEMTYQSDGEPLHASRFDMLGTGTGNAVIVNDDGSLTAVGSSGNSVKLVQIEQISALDIRIGSSEVAVGDNITVTFSENILLGSSGMIELVDEDDSDNTIQIDVGNHAGQLSINGATLTINPTASLVSGHTYHVAIAEGAIKDSGGNGFLGTTSEDYPGLSFATPSTAIFVVVDDGAMWIDTSRDGVHDANERTIAVIGNNGNWNDANGDNTTGDNVANATGEQIVDLAAKEVTIRYNELPNSAWVANLTGFGANDKIEIDDTQIRSIDPTRAYTPVTQTAITTLAGGNTGAFAFTNKASAALATQGPAAFARSSNLNFGLVAKTTESARKVYEFSHTATPLAKLGSADIDVVISHVAFVTGT